MPSAPFRTRSKTIDYDQLSSLHYMGNYERILPVSITRMIENAYDWEHLPYVHPSSFAAIEHIESGPWGWRAKTTLPHKAGKPTISQHIELLVDRSRNYWATTVIDGPGAGMQIHTQARPTEAVSSSRDNLKPLPENNSITPPLDATTAAVAAIAANHQSGQTTDRNIDQDTNQAITVDVQFYLPEKPDEPSFEATILTAMQAQYARLYDEDLTLMQGRQTAIDRNRSDIQAPQPTAPLIFKIDKIKDALPHLFSLHGERFCLTLWKGEWIIYAADCPHLLGPLEHADIDEDGIVTCPWHGYKFNILNGQSCDGKPYALSKPPSLMIKDDMIIVTP